MTQPIAGPCDSPKDVTVNKVPKVFPDMASIHKQGARSLSRPRTSPSQVQAAVSPGQFLM